MKKLFALLVGAVLSTGAWAQTDVTSTYITNANFASTDGWTQDHSSQYWSLGNGSIGTYAVANNKTSTTDATHLSSEYCLGIQCRWSGNYACFTQTTSSLPVGAYVLSFDVENTNTSTTSSQNYANRFTVTVGGTTYTDSKKEWMSGSTGWTTHSISFSVTEATTANISLGYGTGSNNFGTNNTPHLYVSHLTLTWTDPLKAAKDALQEEIDKASLCDAKEGLAGAIATAEGVLASATTQAELEQALADLQAADKDAVLRYENGLADASASNGMLTNFVVNGTFTDNVSGWTCTGGFQNQTRASNQSGDFTVPFFENWNGSAKVNKMYQAISNVPNGTYKLKIAAFVNTLADPNESQYVFANNDKTYLTTGSPTFYEVWTVITNNNVEIGLEQTTATANWMGIDNVSLTYYGAGDVRAAAQAGAHKADWDEAVANANAALANTDYANVTGSEKTALQAEIAKAEPTTADGYDEATAALNAATSAFTAAKGVYDAYAEIRDIAVTLGLTPGDAPANAAAAFTATHTLNVAVYNATTAANIFDVTEVYAPTWSSMGTSSGQHWSGDTSISYADEWRGDTNPTERTATITLPAGEYILMSAGRASANVVATMSANGTTVTYARNGDVGVGIDLTGAANFAETADTYNNNNNGTGWEWRYIPVTLSAETAVTVIQKLTRLSGSAWGSFCDFRILKKGTVADASDYAALNAAIEAAETKTLGFEDGQYAPYNNVAALEALAIAKAFDQTATNEKETVEAVTASLTSLTWNANSGDVDAIYNGMFATVAEGKNYPDGWTRTNGWGQMQSGLSGDFATAYYNQPGSLQYGNQGIYTMPLAANTSYKLTFTYRSHENNSNRGVTASVLNAEDGLAAVTFSENGSTSSWKTVEAYFTTGAAGNYILSLANNGNTWMTNVSLVKVSAPAVAIDQTVAFSRSIETYAEVALSRTIKAAYNTLVLPFDLTQEEVENAFGAGAKVYIVDSYANSNITFATRDGIAANQPVLLKATVAGTAYTFPGRIIKKVDEPTYEGTDVKMVGAYTYGTTEIPTNANNYVIATKNDEQKFYLVTNVLHVNNTRTYINVTESSETKAFLTMSFDDGTETSIEAINANENENGAIYNLAGQRVSKAQKGIYIINGKKVVVK